MSMPCGKTLCVCFTNLSPKVVAIKAKASFSACCSYFNIKMPSSSDRTAGNAASTLISLACNSRFLLWSQLKGNRLDGNLARWMCKISEIVAIELPCKLTSVGPRLRPYFIPLDRKSKDCLVFKCANI